MDLTTVMNVKSLETHKMIGAFMVPVDLREGF